MWEGRRGERKVEAEWTSVLEEGLEEGRGSHTQRGPLMARRSAGMERYLQGIRGSEENMASISPSSSGPGEPAGIPDLNPHTPGPTLDVQVPNLSPTSAKNSSGMWVLAA